jgi:aprataxin
MRPLHLHLVSDDLDGDRMKRKKHWNSFATDFFLPAADAERMLASAGRIDVDAPRARELLSAPLRCHRCGQPQRNMPLLRAHVRACAGGPGGVPGSEGAERAQSKARNNQ